MTHFYSRTSVAGHARPDSGPGGLEDAPVAPGVLDDHGPPRLVALHPLVAQTQLALVPNLKHIEALQSLLIILPFYCPDLFDSDEVGDAGEPLAVQHVDGGHHDAGGVQNAHAQRAIGVVGLQTNGNR